MNKNLITCIGDGRFGEALMHTVATNHPNREVSIVTYAQRHEERAISEKTYRHFPEIALPDNVRIVRNEQGAKEAELLVLCTKAQLIESILNDRFKHLRGTQSPVLSASKGIQNSTQRRCSQVISQTLHIPNTNVAALAGPNFADELIQKTTPLETVIAGCNTVTEQARELFHCDNFSVQTSEDITGLEMCGAAKNVLAIFAGIVEQLHPDNEMHQILRERCLAELSTFVQASGGTKDIVHSPAGEGDLFLTMFNDKSRNRTFGKHLFANRQESASATVEGRATATAVATLAKITDADTPILHATAALLQSGKKPDREWAEVLLS